MWNHKRCRGTKTNGPQPLALSTDAYGLGIKCFQGATLGGPQSLAFSANAYDFGARLKVEVLRPKSGTHRLGNAVLDGLKIEIP